MDTQQLEKLIKQARADSRMKLALGSHNLTIFPTAIGELIKLRELYLPGNQITSLPQSIGQLTNLQELHISGNQLTDLSVLQKLTQSNLSVYFLEVDLPQRYRTKFSEWEAE
jgi:leucine-rich repeat protein SHOC2